MTQQGARYEETKELGIAAVAALIRKDIKAAKAKGDLPDRIYVKLQVWCNRAAIYVFYTRVDANPFIQRRLETIVEAYNNVTFATPAPIRFGRARYFMQVRYGMPASGTSRAIE